MTRVQNEMDNDYLGFYITWGFAASSDAARVRV